MKSHNFTLAIGLLACTGITYAQNTPLTLPSFSLISEFVEEYPGSNHKFLVREIALSDGNHIKLRHIDAGDGLLTLNSSDQPEETLRQLDAFCATQGDRKVSRASKSYVSRDSISLLPCTKIKSE